MSQIIYWEQKGVEIPPEHPFRRDLEQFDAALSQQVETSSGHLDFEAVAQEVLEKQCFDRGWYATSTAGQFRRDISAALREAHASGADHAQDFLNWFNATHKASCSQFYAEWLHVRDYWGAAARAREDASAQGQIEERSSRDTASPQAQDQPDTKIAEKRIMELEAVLRPFAEAEEHEDMDFSGDTPLYGILTGGSVKLIDLRLARAVLNQDDRTCTCHPDDNPPRPCPKKYAYSECVAASQDRSTDAQAPQAITPLPKAIDPSGGH